ncbi:DUF4145 domain-containing protein [Nocardia fluminea]|uniref:DUF4145 domain-containing protein n=1 Tax=Nocardia fluminea TaxID=134984 RepID=UPI0033D8B686
MVNRVCWHCKAFAHMDPVEDAIRYKETNSGHTQTFCTFQCASCRWPVLGVHIRRGSQGATRLEIVDNLIEAEFDWYPSQPTGKRFPDVPAHIAEAAKEATGCLSVGHRRAAVILARGVVEATAKEKGITKGTLAAKIEELEAKRLIRAHTKGVADEIRLVGNDMAHGDFATSNPTQDEAQDVLSFMEEILDEVYQGPARLNRTRAAREAKKAPPTP